MINFPAKKRLFIKIFLWFWLATLLIISIFFLIPLLVQSDYFPGGWRGVTTTALGIYGQTAADLYERQGADALKSYLERIADESKINGFLLDTENKEISNRRLPNDFDTISRRALIKNEPQFELKNLEVLAALKITTKDNQYVFLAEIPRTVSYSVFAIEPQIRFLRVSLIVLTSLLVCFWLTRYLTKPIVKLNDAANRISSGDLTTRIGEIFGGRKDELTDLSRSFDQMAEQLESLMKAQSRLLGDISHELRSPLARLGVAASLARDGDKIEVAEALDVIEREAASINEMIAQLLTITKLESVNSTANFTEIELVELIGEIVADVKFEISGQTKTVEIGEIEKFTIRGDRKTLRSAIENVVRNAVNYTAENTSVEINACFETVRTEKYFTIKVRDYGGGVPENTLTDLFQAFYRVADDRDRSSGGIGLGLAIADRAIKLHGGKIYAENARNNGLLVTITLPA